MQKMGKKLVLFPLPLQGHQTPMLQLANILYSKGFSISIIHTHFNSPNPANHPHFTFHPIPESLLGSKASIADVIGLLNALNVNCVAPFRDLLGQILSENVAAGEPVACLITDAMWHFTQDVADSFKLPRIVLRTSNMSSFVAFVYMSVFREKGYLSSQGGIVLEDHIISSSIITIMIITHYPPSSHHDHHSSHTNNTQLHQSIIFFINHSSSTPSTPQQLHHHHHHLLHLIITFITPSSLSNNNNKSSTFMINSSIYQSSPTYTTIKHHHHFISSSPSHANLHSIKPPSTSSFTSRLHEPPHAAASGRGKKQQRSTPVHSAILNLLARASKAGSYTRPSSILTRPSGNLT